MIKRVIILGNHIQALGISRIVKKIGCEVVLCSNYKISVSRFSNSVDKFLFFRNYNEILNKIFFYKNDENDTLLIPTNDRMVEFIRDNYKYLNTHFYLSVPTPEIISLCYNKKNTYLKAKELNISIPNSLSTSSKVISVSSTVSCNKEQMVLLTPNPISSTQIIATAKGCRI